ncbi:hypothetical protein GCM10022255_090230 [Dactylosporangium darangshiense]|uniref:Uncharacterized protein n=2 Tax=Dactylosporangium darangshiense TaxID=579108 RepID=A0ABP8DNX3_9ACTN
MELDPDRTAWWQRAIAAVALLSAVLATVLLIGTTDFLLVDGVAVALTLVTAVPLFASDRLTFHVASVICAVLLIVLALPLVFFGAHLYLPSAGLLLLARFTGRSRLPQRFWAAAVAVLLVLVVTPWSAAIWDSMLRPPNMYVVYLPDNGPQPSHDTVLYDGSGIGYGVTGVSESDDKLYVTFRRDLSGAELTRLEGRLHELMPYATRIERCQSQRHC